MVEHEVERASTTEGLPVSPSMGPVLALVKLPTYSRTLEPRVLVICILCTVIGLGAGCAAWVLLKLIALVTNVSFYGQASVRAADARGNHLGIFVVLVPVMGAIVIGLFARYGSRAVAGHGIPEAMEQVLTNQSRIPARLTFLKPLAAAISIGTGGPFGAEGPIIATGGALGSLIGQIIHVSEAERKVLLSAGAAAGIAAAFGCPIAAVLLAIELLLFEFRPRSIIPVVFASAAATMIHLHFLGSAAMFPLTGEKPAMAGTAALLSYTALGCVAGLGAVGLTRSVYATEHFFEHLKLHWMWHPAVGAIVVGVIGYFDPRTFGAGYFNLDWLLSDHVVLTAALSLCLLKTLSWICSLGSGTSGGTLAPVFTIGGSLTAAVAIAAADRWPGLGIDVRVAALVGMVAIFAGASRALLTSAVFAYEITREPAGILPALCGCAAAYVVSALLMRHSIMTVKMARQGVRVPTDYSADRFEHCPVSEVMTPKPITLRTGQTIGDVRAWLNDGDSNAGYHGYPVMNEAGILTGLVTRWEVLDAKRKSDETIGSLLNRPPVLVYGDSSLRDAADHMVNHNVGRLPVIERGKKGGLVGIITQQDILRSTARGNRG